MISKTFIETTHINDTNYMLLFLKLMHLFSRKINFKNKMLMLMQKSKKERSNSMPEALKSKKKEILLHLQE